MIPLRDLNPTRTRPTVTYTLIAINVAVFLYQLYLQTTGGGAAGQELIERFGVVPKMLLEGHPGSLVTPITSMFLHGGLLHVIGNMWFLHIFGDNVEDHFGKVRYLAFYFVTGIAAAIAQSLISPDSVMPMVGASGAIAGVLGAYVRLYPHARIVTVVPIFVFLQFVEIPALFFIVVWFGLQALNAWLSLGSLEQGGVAFFAHIGGFLVGLLIASFVKGRTHERDGQPYRTAYVRHDDRRQLHGDWGVDRHRPR